MIALIGLYLLLALAPAGLASDLIRAGVAIMAGRALAAGLAPADGTPARSGLTTFLYVGAVWLATLSPVVLLGHPDATRSSAVAAALVLLLSGRTATFRFTVAATLFVVAVAATGSSAHAGALGDIEFALGATWPRDLSHPASVAGYFLLGSTWANPRNDQGV
jgi:hypothetical protein